MRILSEVIHFELHGRQHPRKRLPSTITTIGWPKLSARVLWLADRSTREKGQQNPGNNREEWILLSSNGAAQEDHKLMYVANISIHINRVANPGAQH